MDLLDRYLEVVRFFLPAKDQDDIIRELRETWSRRLKTARKSWGARSTKRNSPLSCGDTAIRSSSPDGIDRIVS